MSIVFHKKQKDIFLGTVKSGTLSHAYIIEGQAGIGKKTFALYAAKAILCSNILHIPCCSCSSCKKVDKLIHPDLRLISASESGSFKVDSVRELIKTVYYLPNESEKKVYILDMAHKMTPSAQNALLKIFEEPPDSAVFFILTEKRDALLPTVLSRGQIITLLPPETDEILAFLREKYPKKDISELRSAAEVAGNVPGAALTNTDKTSLAERERALEFAKLIFCGKPSDFSVYTFMLPVKSKRETALCFLDQLLYILKELTMYKLTSGNSVILDKDTVYSMTKSHDGKVFSDAAELTVRLYCDIENNGNLTSCTADYISDLMQMIK